MKCRISVAFLFLLTLLTIPVLAQTEGAANCPVLPIQSETAVTPMVDEAPATPDLDLFLPSFEYRGCFMDCVNDWNTNMCAGLTGAEHQQCINDGAEGCRCNCGMWCY